MGILKADGAFAEYVAVPLANLHRVPDGVGDEEAVFTEPLAAAFEILIQVQVNPGDEILVLGDCTGQPLRPGWRTPARK
jgi:threonine dehydrogenase-like Zn-dependent dehydrogenase